MKTITEEKPTRMFKPGHPGSFLRTEIINAHNLSVTEAAKVLKVSRPTLSSLLRTPKRDLSMRDGPCASKGFRRRYGNTDENAKFLRHRGDSQKRKENPCRAF